MSEDQEKATDLESFQRIEAFVRETGIPVSPAPTSLGHGDLPGLRIVSGEIEYDLTTLTYPGDVLYYAGSIAICHPSFRATLHSPFTFLDQGQKAAHGMVVSAWCFAACRSLGLSPRIVFHEGGYQGQGEWIIQSFEGGQNPGVPLLQLFGMAFDPQRAQAQGGPAYPEMVLWLRGDDPYHEISLNPKPTSMDRQTKVE